MRSARSSSSSTESIRIACAKLPSVPDGPAFVASRRGQSVDGYIKLLPYVVHPHENPRKGPLRNYLAMRGVPMPGKSASRGEKSDK